MNFWRIAGLEQTWAGSWVALDLNTLRIAVTGGGRPSPVQQLEGINPQQSVQSLPHTL